MNKERARESQGREEKAQRLEAGMSVTGGVWGVG